MLRALLLLQALNCALAHHNCSVNWFQSVTVLNKPEAPDAELFRADLLDLKTDKLLAVLHAKIPVLCEGSISNLPLLEHLQLSRLGIEEIHPHPFKNLPNLRRLFLKDNNVSEVSNGVFNALPVQYLDLSFNRIVHVDQFAFDNMPNLEALDLSHNRLRKLNHKWFFDCPNLHSLSFRNNQLKEIPPHAFKYLEEPDKTVIHLEDNKISKVASKAFGHFQSDLTVFLDGNKLEGLPKDTFQTDGNTVELSLADNQFKCVEDEVLEHLASSCSFVSIEDNPLTCPCKEKLKKFSDENFENLDFAYENNVMCPTNQK